MEEHARVARSEERFMRAFYTSIHGPVRSERHPVRRPANAASIAKGLPVTPHQAERLAGAAAELEKADARSMRIACREVGIRDAVTIAEVVRRQKALVEGATPVIKSVRPALRDIFRKSEPARYQLGEKLLKPYLECLIADEVSREINRHMYEVREAGASQGWDEGQTANELVPADRANRVWFNLVERAGQGYDSNLVRALECASRSWVIKRATALLQQHVARQSPPERYAY